MPTTDNAAFEAEARVLLREWIDRSPWYPELPEDQRREPIEGDVERFWTVMVQDAVQRLPDATPPEERFNMNSVWMRVASAAAIAAAVPAESRAGHTTSDMVPIAVLAGVDEPTIAKWLEKPSHCERVKQGRKCYYNGGAVEIVFIGGLADWFTVNPQNAPYIASSLSQLGLGPNESRVLRTSM